MIFNFFTLNTAEQLDLFYTENGQLNLNLVRENMIEKRAPIGDNGAINGEGFINPTVQEFREVRIIGTHCASQGSLGYFNESRLENGVFVTQRIQHHYYSRSFAFVTADSDLILRFDYSTEEASKSKVKSLIEELGFEASIFRLDHELLRQIQTNYNWTAAKIDKIERYGDSTKRVSYEIDPADDQFPSQVHEEYREHGQLSHVTFEFPYEAPGAPNTVTVKLYNAGHRIVIDENELGQASIEHFIITLLNVLKGLR